MARAIEGAALIGAAVAMEVGAAMYNPWLLASPTYQHAALGIALGGAAMEAGAIASALTSNRGMNITTRQLAAYRQVIYGQQRVGGVTIFESTTGSHHDQYNYVIVIAGHEVYNIENLYLDGRQVFWQGSGAGYSVRNGVGFGGIADSANHTGPDGVQYNFGGTGHSGLYCEARYGDQLPGDVIGGLTANDPSWAADGHGNSPWVGGCCYVYLKIEANSSLFPAPPEIKFTVNGKCDIYDPRTGTRGYTNNWALVAADVLTDPVFGLGDSSVNEAQLIAAANVCDELVEVAALSATTPTYEARYTTNWHTDTSTGPGDILSTMMTGAAGRLSRIGGEWYLWPAYWQGPSFTCDENALTAAPSWKPYRSTRDLFNRVRGTYCAPNFPWNIAGNLYDANGFYNGTFQNNFAYAFQQTNYPEYACDVLHGYSSDQYLNEDGGRPLVKELGLQTVLSVTQAQRVAKITLLRNRQQGSGTLSMGLPSYGIQPCDTMRFSFPEFGWSEKTLEVTSVAFNCEQQQSSTGDKAMAITLNVGVIEADSSVYEWSTTEELTVYDVPALPTQQSRFPAPPTGMSLTCSSATALTDPITGIVTPRIEVQWTTPLDVLTTGIQVQYQLDPAGTPTGPWIDAGVADVSLNLYYIGNLVNGGEYNVRIRSVRPNGTTSTWVEIDGYTASLTLTVATQLALAPGTLVGEAVAPITITAATTSGSPDVAVISATGAMYVGQGVSGSGIPSGVTIAALGLGTITLSASATATASPVSLTGAGTAIIEPVSSGSFSCVVGNTTLTVSPSNYPLGVVNQGQLYFVYYIDTALVGGSVTAIATQNPADYLNKPGYFLIDSVITPVSPTTGGGGGGGGTYTGTTGGRYRPSRFTDSGTRTTASGALAYDADVTTYATVGGSFNTSGAGGGAGTDGICVWDGFPAGTQPPTTLHFVAAILSVSGAIPYEIDVSIGSSVTTLVADSTTFPQSDYTCPIPDGTDLSTVSVTVAVYGSEDSGFDSMTPLHHLASVKIYDIYIQ